MSFRDALQAAQEVWHDLCADTQGPEVVVGQIGHTAAHAPVLRVAGEAAQPP